MVRKLFIRQIKHIIVTNTGAKGMVYPMLWFKKKKVEKKEKTLYDIEKELTEAKGRYDVYQKTFLLQGSFTNEQREELMDLRARRDVLELELNKLKFEEVIDHG